jgi:hypothetical protein
MWITVYEVVEVDAAMCHRSCGLFFRARSAVKKAKEIAKQNSHKKIKNKLEWGDVDDWGMLKGVYITMRRVDE